MEKDETATKTYADSKFSASLRLHLLVECLEILNMSIFKISWVYSLSTNLPNSP